MDAKFNSSLRDMIIKNFSIEYFWEKEELIEHALEVMSDGQKKRLYALLKNNLNQETEQFINELQSYQIRR